MQQAAAAGSTMSFVPFDTKVNKQLVSSETDPGIRGRTRRAHEGGGGLGKRSNNTRGESHHLLTLSGAKRALPSISCVTSDTTTALKYEDQTADRILDKIKLNVLVRGHADEALRGHLQLNNAYTAAWKEMYDVLGNEWRWRAADDSTSTPNWTPLWQEGPGGGHGDGKGQKGQLPLDVCGSCHKQGHREADRKKKKRDEKKDGQCDYELA